MCNLFSYFPWRPLVCGFEEACDAPMSWSCSDSEAPSFPELTDRNFCCASASAATLASLAERSFSNVDDI